MELSASPPGLALCQVCLEVPWLELQAEDSNGYPHHQTGQALELSAKSCPMCRLVLHAATEYDRDNLASRTEKHYCVELHNVQLQDGSTVRRLQYNKSFGACMPDGNSHYGRGLSGGVLSMIGSVDRLEDASSAAAATDRSASRLNPETKTMTVWVYANHWSGCPPTGQNDVSHLRLVGIGARFGRSKHPWDAYGTNADSINLRGSSIGVCVPEDTSLKFIPGRLREKRSNSDIAFSRLEGWVGECRRNHPLCSSPSLTTLLPTRVLDVFGSARGVSLLQTSVGERGRYIALSHCWGPSSRLMTTKESLQDMEEGIAISFLPKTFQDAISITKRLCIKYLWIDCLCIIQDDPADWESEAAKMAEVYRNAYLTISAASSPDSYTGCFPNRTKDSYVSPATRSLGYSIPRATGSSDNVLLEWPSSGRNRKIYLFKEWLPGSSMHAPQRTEIGTFGRKYDPLGEETLNTRGWTLQERFLSPRIVHYATDQMFYECETQIVSEDGWVFPDTPFSMSRILQIEPVGMATHGIPQNSSISLVPGKSANLASSRSHGRWAGGWLSLVENYSRRRLTKSNDKLSALAGVARVIAEHTKDRYLAGVWLEHIPEDLCWRIYTQEEPLPIVMDGSRPRMGAVIGEVKKLDEYRAPTWSWAYLDAPIRFIPLTYSNLVVRVVNASTTPAGIDPFGRVSSGKVELAGPIFRVEKYKPKESWHEYGIPVEIDLKDDRGTCIGSFFPDFPDESLEYPYFALFLDPANALILRGTDVGIPSADGRTITPSSNLGKRASKPVLTSDELKRRQAPEMIQLLQSQPEYKDHQLIGTSGVPAIRVGFATFMKTLGGENGRGKKGKDHNMQEASPMLDEALNGEALLKRLAHVKGDGSWGPVTKNDLKIWVQIF